MIKRAVKSLKIEPEGKAFEKEELFSISDKLGVKMT
jgi:hypothetical protein